MALTYVARKSCGGSRPPLDPLPVIVYIRLELQDVVPELEAAATAENVASIQLLLGLAARKAAKAAARHIVISNSDKPPNIHLASLSPVPAAVECLVAAGASVLEEAPMLSKWEELITKKHVLRKLERKGCGRPPPACWEDEHNKGHSCLQLATEHSPSLQMVRLLAHITLQQAKQQWRQQQQQQQATWDRVLFDLVKGPLGCRPERAALVLQQIVGLEGAAAATSVVTRLLEGSLPLSQDSKRKAVSHLAKVLLLVWLEVCGQVVQQQVSVVARLPQASAVLLLPQEQPALAQQAAQVPMPASWGPVHIAVADLYTAAVAAAAAATAPGEKADSDSETEADSNSETVERFEAPQQEDLDNLVASIARVFELQASGVGAGGDEEQLQQPQEDEDAAEWVAADALADLLCNAAKREAASALANLLCTAIAEGQHAVVEAAAAELCRQLLAAWLGAREQLRQELVDAVVHAVEDIAAGRRSMPARHAAV